MRLGITAVIIGSATIAISLVFYYIATLNIVLGPETDALLTPGAEATLAAFCLGLVLVIVGVHLLFRAKMRLIRSVGVDNAGAQSWLSTLTVILSDGPYNSLFIISGIVYAFIFAFFSGMLVYQSSPSFSEQYLVSVPSVLTVTCCGPIGQTPRLVVYVTDHLGILLIPVNFILLVTISWMVGANASIAFFAYRRMAESGLKWLGSFGAITGLFTACPTCASFVILGGVGAGEALAAILAPAQLLLLVASETLLVGNLFVMSRRITSARACKVNAV